MGRDSYQDLFRRMNPTETHQFRRSAKARRDSVSVKEDLNYANFLRRPLPELPRYSGEIEQKHEHIFVEFHKEKKGWGLKSPSTSSDASTLHSASVASQ